MCEFCEKEGLLKTEIVYHYIVKPKSDYFKNTTATQERHIAVKKCPICGRDLRREENE